MLLSKELALVAFTDANYLLIESLVDASMQEGFEFVRRTIDDWNSGSNRFSQTRHLYIRQAHRRKGCAALLMNTIIGRARLHFHQLRLLTANPVAAAFYEQLGFEHLPGYKVSHVLVFSKHG